ncbi:YqgE/AlgH family protein [Akkermansiaceae bacterium]|nr:YqgE/AlgH family protein [Akkermansiaceae bacterium]
MPDEPSTSEQPISLGGRLLLASPALADGTFDRSVILLIEHSSTTGAHGIIINHPTGNTVGDLLKGPEFKSLAHLPVHHGGPLSSGELSFSAFSLAGETGIRHRTHISLEAAAKLVAKGDHIIRATIGHSAWSPGQLENELQRNTWITLRPSGEILAMEHDLTLWTNLLKGISPYHHLLSQAPQNPFLN